MSVVGKVYSFNDENFNTVVTALRVEGYDVTQYDGEKNLLIERGDERGLIKRGILDGRFHISTLSAPGIEEVLDSAPESL